MSTETDREEPVGPDRRSRVAGAMDRRRLLRGGLSAAPVIMTLASGGALDFCGENMRTEKQAWLMSVCTHEKAANESDA
jgi:hypothetical protein